MQKRINIRIAASGYNREAVVDDGMTPGELLRQVNLRGYHLSTDGRSTNIIPSNQEISPFVREGDELWATTDPKVGVAGYPATLPYHIASSWRQAGSLYRGYYKTQYGNFAGEIDSALSSNNVFIFSPPSWLKSNPCFGHLGNNWWMVHFETKTSVDEAILKIEQMINAGC